MRVFTIILLAAGINMAAESAEWKSGFETADFSGWNTQGSGWNITDKSVASGQQAAMCTIAKGEASNIKACAHLIEKAEAGWVVKVGLQVAGRNKSKSSVFTASVVCINAEGAIVGEVKKKVSDPDKTFQPLVLPEIIIPSGATETYLMLVVEVPAEARGNEWWRFDDIAVQIK